MKRLTFISALSLALLTACATPHSDGIHIAKQGSFSVGGRM